MKPLFLLVISFIFLSCGNPQPEMGAKYEHDTIAMKEVSASIDEDLAPAQKNTDSQLSKKAIKKGQINFQSEGITKDYLKVKTLISSYDSYIDSENETNTDYQANYDITIRVNAKDYDSLFSKLAKLSKKLDFKSSHIEDVTARFYDLKTRIKNKKLLEARYVKLLNKATSVKDMLEIERSINEIRNEIESAEGSFRYLNKQISYSTIHLNFYEKLSVKYTEKGFWSRILNAAGRGWKGFLSSLVNAVQYWPWLIIFTVGFYVYKKIKSFWRKTK